MSRRGHGGTDESRERKEEEQDMRKRRAGFTLIELMVVAIIVAILAAVAIPLMSANKKRAAVTEAESALGTIRSAARAMYAETEAYNLDQNGNDPSGPATGLPGIGVGDLDGRYFEDDDYTYAASDANNYTITAVGDTAGSAVDGDIVNGVTITLDQDGEFTYTGL